MSTPMPQPWAREVETFVPSEASGEELWQRNSPHVSKFDFDGLLAHTRELEAALKEADRKMAVLFDESVYSDSLGVEGSNFLVCRWCGGGSGPGGNPSFKHSAGCLLDDDALEKLVAYVWQEDKAEIAELQTELAASPSLWLGRALSVVQESSDIDEAEQAIQKLLDEETKL